MHDRPYTVVDGILIGNNPGSRGAHGDKARRKPRKCSKCAETGMYEKTQTTSVQHWVVAENVDTLTMSTKEDVGGAGNMGRE